MSGRFSFREETRARHMLGSHLFIVSTRCLENQYSLLMQKALDKMPQVESPRKKYSFRETAAGCNQHRSSSALWLASRSCSQMGSSSFPASLASLEVLHGARSAPQPPRSRTGSGPTAAPGLGSWVPWSLRSQVHQPPRFGWFHHLSFLGIAYLSLEISLRQEY